jgi:hypothetical protein
VAAQRLDHGLALAIPDAYSWPQIRGTTHPRSVAVADGDCQRPIGGSGE